MADFNAEGIYACQLYGEDVVRAFMEYLLVKSWEESLRLMAAEMRNMMSHGEEMEHGRDSDRR